MLLTLIKKQYWECFRSYFISRRTGKPRAKWHVLLLFVLFGIMMVMLSGMFFGQAYLMGKYLPLSGMIWLFYALFGSVAVLLGVFGSVFNTYSMLYLAKDNDLLLAMPIPPTVILLSRMSLVYGMALLYSGVVWLPMMVYAWIFLTVSWKAVLFQLLLTLIIALLVAVLTCALGWVVALISSRMKNKNIIIVVLSLLLFSGYYYACMNMTGLFTQFLTNASAIGDGLRTWANLLYQLGMAADGNGSAMLIFTGVTAVLATACIFVMSRSFRGIVTRTHGTGKRKAERLAIRSRSLGPALLQRELRRFTASPTYMLNCGMGSVLLVAAAVVLLIKQDLLQQALRTVSFIPGAKRYFPAMAALAVSAISGISFVSTPSISLEGKNLWVLRSLPVTGRQVLRAKLALHLLLNVPAVTAAYAAAARALKIEWPMALVSWVFCLGVVWACGAFGLMLGVLRPNFQWTSEIVPIKQSMICMISMLAGMLLPIAVCIGSLLLTKWLTMTQAMAAAAALVLCIAALLQRWLDTKGAACFDRL